MSVSLGSIKDNLLRMKDASTQLHDNWETLTPEQRNKLWWEAHKAKAHLQGQFDKGIDDEIKIPGIKGKPGQRD